MNTGHWITIGMFGVTQLTALIITYINVRLKIKELEIKIENMKQSILDKEDSLNEKIKTNQHSFHIHEQQNERMFDKYEKKLDDVYDVVSEVKNILINKNFS